MYKLMEFFITFLCTFIENECIHACSCKYVKHGNLLEYVYYLFMIIMKFENSLLASFAHLSQKLIHTDGTFVIQVHVHS